ncbi:hypothetical protein VFPPC_18003 [Pochonia chlamydosporia 170]|uniref:Uncharacterized protein n=1 Tax=Pochonia chlamydosporia 170 TaxID=1380566 RepID=A0A219APK7_METCM|nr:hypothetical protein VFPPC_18003 [Pochonia chlamydosporia 170]OWT42748.1 hypothetical protein VFPPC_18003 [Pochonia chlamydosporia 170]
MSGLIDLVNRRSGSQSSKAACTSCAMSSIACGQNCLACHLLPIAAQSINSHQTG